jgi:uncharacterized protein (DUF983 family)
MKGECPTCGKIVVESFMSTRTTCSDCAHDAHVMQELEKERS